MKAGARARKDSFPMAQICFPVMCCHGCCCIATPSSENSLIAQCIQWATAASDHCLGSGKKKENKNKNRIIFSATSRFFRRMTAMSLIAL